MKVIEEGVFIDGLLNGVGRVKLVGKHKYIGHWKSGNLSGEGLREDSKGNFRFGTWNDHKLEDKKK